MFKDLFSNHASAYAKYRPTYPEELFAFLAAQSPHHHRAWDCATGNGQAARSLVDYFAEVVATDASAKQLEHAAAHPKIKYLVAPAESCPEIAANSIDLITVASAIHWFNFEKFYDEVRRVLRPGGVIAAWVFRETDEHREFDQVLRKFQKEILGPYWPEETQKWIMTEYKTLPFPFTEIKSPEFRVNVEWTAEDALGYLATWSATPRYIAERKQNPLDLIREDLIRSVQNEGGLVRRGWKLILKVGRL